MSHTPPPQLVMVRRDLENLVPLSLPDDVTVRSFEPGDENAWDRIINDSFGNVGIRTFYQHMAGDYPYRPERVWFACVNGEPVATASAWYRPAYGKDCGTLHMVGALGSAAGRGLGYIVCLAAIKQMRREGRQSTVLTTDDYRLPAIVTYVKLGYEPLIVEDAQRERWRVVFRELGKPEWIQRFDTALTGPVFVTQGAGKNMDRQEKYKPRQRWHPQRPAVGGSTGGGDPDFLGDESLYHPSALGTAAVEPAVVEAGSPIDQPLTLTYTVGKTALIPGDSVSFAIRGQIPLGVHWGWASDQRTSGFTVEGPAGCELQMVGLRCKLLAGRVEPGQALRLTLKLDPNEPMHWHRVAGRRKFYVTLLHEDARPDQRLPEPSVVDILPKAFSRYELTLPCTHRRGDAADVRVTARDEFDNRVDHNAAVELTDGGQQTTAYLSHGLGDATLPGSDDPVLRVRQVGGEAVSNPSVVSDDLQLYLGDLHCHDMLSEAEGYCDDVMRFARDERRFDFLSTSVQSHGGHDNEKHLLHKYHVDRYHEEGRFVTLLAFEWQHTAYGDKVIHYLGGDQPVLPVDDGRYSTPTQLYEALRQSDAMIISHHVGYPAGSWCSSTDWSVVENDVERVVELWSMHGSNEGFDPSDRPMRNFDQSRQVMAALRRGLRLGFVAGSDSHAGRPGGSAQELLGYWGGCAAVWAPALTRRDLFKAIYDRQTYALTGARIVLRFAVNDAMMGREIPASDEAKIQIDAWAPGTIDRVQIIKNTQLLKEIPVGRDECHITESDKCEGPAFYHARVIQTDGQLAVCSPVWVG